MTSSQINPAKAGSIPHKKILEKGEKKMVEVKLTWKSIKQLYEKKTHHKIQTYDFSTPELVKAYIEKYELGSSSAEFIFSIRKDTEVPNSSQQ